MDPGNILLGELWGIDPLPLPETIPEDPPRLKLLLLPPIFS